MSQIKVEIDAYLRLRELNDELQAELGKTKQHYYAMKDQRDYLRSVLLDITTSKTHDQAKTLALRAYESDT
jgi:hypothetical protein